MLHQCNKEVHYLQFDSFIEKGLPHGFFMRHGGVSQHPWSSLNLGGNSGDARENVIENRKRIFNAIEKPVESLFDVWQVHSDTIICTNEPRNLSADHIRADAILTNRPEITLFMRFADCVPICVYDTGNHVVGIIHAGWPGTIKKITLKTIQKMEEVYGSKPQNIIAGIGPSICVNHFEIKNDVIEQVVDQLSPYCDRFLLKEDGHTYFNLQEANRFQLEKAGVENIEDANICTACNTNDWFSHRGEKGLTGRFGALLAL